MKTPQELYAIINAVRLRVISEDEAVQKILQQDPEPDKDKQQPEPPPRANSQRS